MNQRTTTLCCLLLTAALLAAMPGLLSSLSQQDGQRMSPRLRPSKAQPLVIWLLRDPTDSGKHLRKQIALFEQANPSARVFLRNGDAQDLLAENAVLPDVVLFAPGDLLSPGQVLLPLVATHSLSPALLLAGQSALTQYALPLWFSPNLLAVPSSLLPPALVATPQPTASSFFALSTPLPQADAPQTQEVPALPDTSSLPWEIFVTQGALALPQGVALQQLLSMCPLPKREALVRALTAQPAPALPTPSAAPSAQVRGASRSAGATPTAITRVLSLAAYRSAEASGQALLPFAMTPATTEHALFVGLCKDNSLSRSFVTYLLSPAAAEGLYAQGLLPASPIVSFPGGDALYAQLVTLYAANPLLPNAFEYRLQELHALCLDAFTRLQDPVETLLRLR